MNGFVAIARWPTLLDEVCADLVPDNDACPLFTSLSVLRKLVGIHEFKGKESRKALDVIIDRTWPILLPTAARLLKEGGPENAEAMTLFKLALKIYWSCTQLCLSNSPLVVSTMDSWFELLSACIMVPGKTVRHLYPTAVIPRHIHRRFVWFVLLLRVRCSASFASREPLGRGTQSATGVQVEEVGTSDCTARLLALWRPENVKKRTRRGKGRRRSG